MSFESSDLDAGEDERKRDSSRKRDGKRDKREKGYQVFESEDDDDEPLALAEDLKSPSKQKKERVKPSFKFPVSVRKDKTKEKEDKKEKEAKQEEKEKKKEEKEKKKHKKEKKKSKHSHKEAAPAIVEPKTTENPIFGVPLAVAVERNKSHDGIQLPALVRECIDHIEEFGLACEGIYRLSGVKSKVQQLRENYNRGQRVSLMEHEPNVVASLLKLFLRELPEPVLTSQLMPKFEEASTIKNNKKKVEAFIKLIADLPTCNRLLLSWMIVHMTHVIELAKENKMSLQNVSIVLSPTMQISHRVLNVLFSNAADLFADIQLRRYVPPLRPAHSKWSLELPDNLVALEEELAKQESLLNQLHAELHSGKEDPHTSEQLWEVQRVVTQLKRKIKLGKKNMELAERRRTNLEAKRSSNSSLPSLSAPEELQLDLRTPPSMPAPQGEEESDKNQEDVGEKGEDKETVASSSDADLAKKDTKPEQEPKKEVKFVEEKTPQTGDSSVVESSTVETEAAIKPVDKEEIEEKIDSASKGDDSVGKDEEKADEEVQQADKVPEEQEVQIKEEEEVKPRSSVEIKETEEVMTVQKDEDVKYVQQPSIATVEEGPVVTESPKIISDEKTNSSASTTSTIPNEEQAVTEEQQPAEKKENKKSVKFVTQEEPQTKTDEESDIKEIDDIQEKKEADVTKVPDPAPIQEKPPKPKVYEYRKAPNPPFVSTSLLKPMKAKPPPPKPATEEESEGDNSRAPPGTESWRQLEEELLGQGADEEDEAEIDKLLEEEYYLKLEEEELLAIADELRQKLASERSEMDRLSQEITELQYLRQDSDLEDLSSASSSSSDSEDEDDLQDLLGQLIQQNQELETNSTDLCQKIHEERMICLSVKLQIRLLQQKQLESSYG